MLEAGRGIGMPDGVMQSGRELEGDAGVVGGEHAVGEVVLAGERVGRGAAGPELGRHRTAVDPRLADVGQQVLEQVEVRGLDCDLRGSRRQVVDVLGDRLEAGDRDSVGDRSGATRAPITTTSMAAGVRRVRVDELRQRCGGDEKRADVLGVGPTAPATVRGQRVGRDQRSPAGTSPRRRGGRGRGPGGDEAGLRSRAGWRLTPQHGTATLRGKSIQVRPFNGRTRRQPAGEGEAFDGALPGDGIIPPKRHTQHRLAGAASSTTRS